jgi:hypothetical protein
MLVGDSGGFATQSDILLSGVVWVGCKLNHIVCCLDQNAWILAERYVLTNSTECSSWSGRRQNGPMPLVDASICLVAFNTCTVARRLCSASGHGPSRSIRLRTRRRRLRDSSAVPAVTQCIAPCAVAVASCTDPQQMILLDSGPLGSTTARGRKVETGCVRICPFRARRWARRARKGARHIIYGCTIRRVINSHTLRRRHRSHSHRSRANVLCSFCLPGLL